MDEPARLSPKPRLLLVQHQPEDMQLLTRLLQGSYEVHSAESGAQAVAWLLANDAPDLVLLDVAVKEPAGLDVCRGLKADALTRDVPVLLLSDPHADDEAAGFEAGAADFIRRPFAAATVLARVKAYLSLATTEALLRDQQGFLERESRRLALASDSTQDAAIYAMAAMSEARESDTGKHVLRVKEFVKTLAQRLKGHPRFADTLTERYISVLFKSSPLCDLGEVSVPDRILLKPGPLTADEFAIMKTHTTKGVEAIAHVEAALGVDSDFLAIARDIAHSHHEKWDGSGYPQGLMGEQIPLAGRIVALADVYDALTSDRVYKAGVPHDKAVQVISQGRGSHFDPDIADAFMEVQHVFQAIAEELADTEDDMQRKMEYLAQAIAEEVQM